MTAGERARASKTVKAQLESDLVFGLEEIPRRAPRATAAPTGAAARAPVAAMVRESSAPPPRPPADVKVHVAPLKARLGDAAKRAELDRLDDEVRGCVSCKLSRTRTYPAPGEGNVDADLLFIGEGPGEEEDRSGRPFVGRAGELLTKIIVAMGFTRESVFIANIVKCRPPENRVPEPDEVVACSPFLDRQIDIVKPKVICTLGLPSTRALLKITSGITAVRGKKHLYRGIVVVPTFHPAYLLRNPAEKPKVWQDVQMIAKLVVELGGVVPNPPASAAGAAEAPRGDTA